MVELVFLGFLSPNVDAVASLFKSTVQNEELLPNSLWFFPFSLLVSTLGLQVTCSLLVLLKALCLLWKGHCYASPHPEKGGS